MTIEMPDTAIILAGGLGLRLRPAIADRPKVLAPAAGRPFLHYLLAYLAGQGIQRVILSVGYLAEQVLDFAQDGQQWGLDISYASEPEPLGTAGALKLAGQGLDSAFFALNGDTLFQIDLPDFWRFHQSTPALITIALRTIAPESGEHDRRGFLRLDNSGMVMSYTEKPGLSAQAQDDPAIGKKLPAMDGLLTNGGVYVLTPEALDGLEPGQPASLELELFPALAARRQLAGRSQSGYFIDIGTPQSLARFEADLERGLDLTARTHSYD